MKRKVKMRKIKPILRKIRKSMNKAWKEQYKNIPRLRYDLEIPAITDDLEFYVESEE